MANIKKCLLICLLFLSLPVLGQRIEIDRLDREFRGRYATRKGYELSQKLIQLDSTYYVGHFYEAKYRYFRASDKRGYEAAIESLEKTLDLLQENFPREIKRSTNIQVYVNRYFIQRRYAYLIDHLRKSYQYVDRPGEAIKATRRLQARDFVCNFGVDTYAAYCWIYFRNRMYGPEKYDFLKPTIEENLRIASLFSDSIKNSQKHNQRYLNDWWPDFAQHAQVRHYHFKNMIFSRELKVDSAEYYSNELRKLDQLSFNNYGNLQFIQAKYHEAEQSYLEARDEDNYSWKSIKEFDYMQSAIKIFQNNLDSAKSIITESIKYLGTAPGFGWNSIALSRAYYYAGDLKQSKLHKDKAANFREVHINTTWGAVDYDRNALLFEYLFHKKSINEIMFKDKYYWYKPSSLYEISKHYFKKESTHLLLTSELSADPERFMSLYNLFASENTIYFDEIWELIKYFNPDYFIEVFKRKLATDEREKVHKYFDYFIGQFHMENESYEEAIRQFDKVLRSEYLDDHYEKLLIARVHEALYKAYSAIENESSADENLRLFYQNFSQLLPFSDLEMKFNLVSKPNLNPAQQTILDELKTCNIEWVQNNPNWPTLIIDFVESERGSLLAYKVMVNGALKFEGNFNLKGTEHPGQLVAYGIFGIKLESRD